MRKWAWFVLAAAVLWGGWLRLRQLDAQSFWIDEAFSVVHAQAIAEHGIPRLATGEVSWLYPLTHYAMAAGLPVCDDVHAGSRLVPALCGTLLAAAMFGLGRWLGLGLVPSLAAAMVLAFMTFEVACSRQARYYAPLQLMLVLAMTAMASLRGRRTPARFALAAVASVAAMACHFSGWMALVFGAALFTPELVRSRAAWCVGAAGLVLALALLPSTLNPLHAIGAPAWKPDRMLNYARFVGGQFGWASVWIAAGLVVVFVRRDRFMGAVAAVVAVYFAYLLFFCPLFHLRYIVPVLPLLVLLGAWGAKQIAEKCGRVGFWVCGSVAVATLVTADVSLRPFDRYYLGVTAPQPDWRAAFAWIEKDGGPRRTVTNFPELHDIYLGGGEKYFVPVSLTGRELLERPNYTTAAVVTNIAEIRALGPGYLVVDAIGMERSGPDDVRDILHKVRPDLILEGPYPLFVWRLETLRVSM
jgi:hypothetical protein